MSQTSTHSRDHTPLDKAGEADEPKQRRGEYTAATIGEVPLSDDQRKGKAKNDLPISDTGASTSVGLPDAKP